MKANSHITPGNTILSVLLILLGLSIGLLVGLLWSQSQINVPILSTLNSLDVNSSPDNGQHSTIVDNLQGRVNDAVQHFQLLIRLFSVIVTLLGVGFGIGIWQTEKFGRSVVRNEVDILRKEILEPFNTNMEQRSVELYGCFAKQLSSGMELILSRIFDAQQQWDIKNLKKTISDENKIKETISLWQKNISLEILAYQKAFEVLAFTDEEEVVNAAQQLGQLKVSGTEPYLEKALDFSMPSSRQRQAIGDALRRLRESKENKK